MRRESRRRGRDRAHGGCARRSCRAPSLDAGRALRALASEWASPAALAVAFTLEHPAVASVLVGVTSPGPAPELLAGPTLHAELDEVQRARLRDVGTGG